MRTYQPRPRCGARKRNGGTCKNGAGANTDHKGAGPCWLHTGATKNGRKNGQRLAAEALAARFGIRVATTATDALADALACENGLVQYLWDQLGTDNPADLVGETRIRAMYGLYESAQTRRTRIASDMARLRIEERRQDLLERDAEVIAAAWERLLVAFARAWNLSPQQMDEGRAIIAGQLEALGGGAS